MIIFGNEGIQLTFTQEDNRSEIEIECNGDLLVCGGESNETMLDLCQEELNDLTTFLDKTKDGICRPVSGDSYFELRDISTPSLIAMENFLKDILGSDSPRRKDRMFINKGGHIAMIAKITDAARAIRDRFLSGDIDHVDISTWPASGEPDSQDPDNWASWYKIAKIHLDFDNMPHEIALLMGHYGGGNVTMAYSYDESDSQCFVDDIANMIVNSTGEDMDAEVYAEFHDSKEEE